jgi:hypothetical protein
MKVLIFLILLSSCATMAPKDPNGYAVQVLAPVQNFINDGEDFDGRYKKPN